MVVLDQGKVKVSRPRRCADHGLFFCIFFFQNKINEKSAQRDANTARVLAVVRFGHRPPAVTNPQTGPITIHCTAAS